MRNHKNDDACGAENIDSNNNYNNNINNNIINNNKNNSNNNNNNNNNKNKNTKNRHREITAILQLSESYLLRNTTWFMKCPIFPSNNSSRFN